MHSAIRRTSLCLVIAAIGVTGCRGPNPFNRFVKVTKEADQDLPEIEAPEQRLATAKPRGDSRAAAGSSQALGVRAADASPHVTRTASVRSAPSESTVPAKRSLSDRDETQARTTAPSKDQQEKTQRSLVDSTPTNLSPSKLDPEDLEQSELMEAFSDYPPEVQREALRRLVAATSKRASRTDQPHGIDIANEVDDLPELPAAKNTAPEVPPHRIASHRSDAATVSISDHDPSGNVDEVDSQLVTTEVESPVVQSLSESTAAQETVKPVSASRQENDPSMVARAAVDSSLSIDLDPATLTSKLSDDALYSSLLQRLATPAPGESEAERASRLIKLRHLMVLAGDPDRAVEKVDGLSKAEQEYLRHQLLGLWTMIDPQGHPVSSRRFTSALPQIREAAKFAAAATDSLEVRSLAFCTEIESYGQIKPFSGNRFDAGQQVILYCEIENFTVAKEEAGFKTHLQGSYDIFNDSNEKVVSQLLPADEQVSANYLRDYFIAYQMHLPAQLRAGTYRLQLTMEDVTGKKYGQASIPFEIAE